MCQIVNMNVLSSLANWWTAVMAVDMVRLETHEVMVVIMSHRRAMKVILNTSLVVWNLFLVMEAA